MTYNVILDFNTGSDDAIAIVASAAPITQFKDFEVNEILCKPYYRAKS
jgi:hypothetical protein